MLEQSDTGPAVINKIMVAFRDGGQARGLALALVRRGEILLAAATVR